MFAAPLVHAATFAISSVPPPKLGPAARNDDLSNINLSRSGQYRQQSYSSNTISAKPEEKAVALADRLRGLRERAENATLRTGPTGGPYPPSALPCDGASDPKAAPPSAVPTNPVNFDDLLETDDGFLEDLLRNENADSAPKMSLDARAELDALRELSRQFSELAKVQDAKDDGDDSGGEGMRRDVEDVVAEAVKNNAGEGTPAKIDPGGDVGAGTEAHRDPGDVADPALSLPSVPTDLPSPTTSPPQDVPNTGDFEDDMARRIAALKNFKPAAQSASDSLDLPSVPTFHPADRKPKPSRGAKPAGRMGFTDEDMETWCVVCLEDGTLICPGCEDDVYCQRCWYEMHRGPAAGYEETLHEAKQFNRDHKRKKVTVGA